MAKSKLKDAIDRHKGVDHALEHQKKLQKAAQKRKRSKIEADQLEEDDDDDEGIDDLIAEDADLDDGDAIAFDEAGNIANGAQDEEEWTDEEGSEDDEEDGEEAGGFDLSRLQDSDSDSESAEEHEAEPAPLQTSQPKLKGTAAGTKVTANTTQKPTTKPVKPSNATTDDANEDDIPLSDISDAGSGDEDIIPHQRLTINNKAALQRALMSIALPTTQLPFSEHMSVTSLEPVVIKDIEDEFERETALYDQALYAARQARGQLKKEGVPFTRPNDYFAEMVKSDEHMGKIKSKLVEQAASEKASKEARRQRDLKKFGKAVQVEKLKERAKAKKDMLEKVNSLKRKRQGAGLDTTNEDDMFDVALEDAATSEKKDREARRAKGSKGEPSKKRQKKDDKFGFGGKKKYSKSNDATSSGDMRGYSAKRMKAPGKAGGKVKVGASKRPGKARRAAKQR